jgi:hypothetical protein
MMDALAAQPPEDTDAETRQRIIARRDLLRRLRGAAPTVDPLAGAPPLADALGSDDAPLAPRPSHLHGDLYQAQEQHFQSAIADRGGVATVVNNIFVQSIERRWSRPTPPELGRDAVARAHEMAQIKAALAARGGVAITGEAVAPSPAIRRTPSLAVQGMAGVGKTVLAYLLVQTGGWTPYADGVIWEELGRRTLRARRRRRPCCGGGRATPPTSLRWTPTHSAPVSPSSRRRCAALLAAPSAAAGGARQRVGRWKPSSRCGRRCPPGVHLVVTTRLGGGGAWACRRGLRRSGAAERRRCAGVLVTNCVWAGQPATGRARPIAWALELIAGGWRPRAGAGCGVGRAAARGRRRPAAWQTGGGQRLLDRQVRSGDLGRPGAARGPSAINVQGLCCSFSVRALTRCRDAAPLPYAAVRLRQRPTSPRTLAAAVWACDAEVRGLCNADRLCQRRAGRAGAEGRRLAAARDCCVALRWRCCATRANRKPPPPPTPAPTPRPCATANDAQRYPTNCCPPCRNCATP